MNTKWESTNGWSGNQVLRVSDRFYISYNPSPGGGISFFAGDDNSAETALCIKTSDNTHFLVLNGDFRREYEIAIKKGIGACLKVYLKHKEKHNSSWTSDFDVALWLKNRGF